MVRFFLIKIGLIKIAALLPVIHGIGPVGLIPGSCRGPGRPGRRARSSPPRRPGFRAGTLMTCFSG